MIKLEQNYRSSGRILKAANILIANNPHVFEKRLFSELGYGTELKVLSANNEEHEAERVTGVFIFRFIDEVVRNQLARHALRFMLFIIGTEHFELRAMAKFREKAFFEDVRVIGNQDLRDPLSRQPPVARL